MDKEEAVILGLAIAFFSFFGGCATMYSLMDTQAAKAERNKVYIKAGIKRFNPMTGELETVRRPGGPIGVEVAK